MMNSLRTSDASSCQNGGLAISLFNAGYTWLDQPQPLQARMPVLADNDVVVHGNAERGRDVDDRFRHLDVGLRRRRVATGMIVHQSNPRSIPLIKLAVLRLRVAQGSVIGSGKTCR